MGWIDRIRSLLGMGSPEPPDSGDGEVTFEREPAAEAERAVKEPVESSAGEDEPAGESDAEEPGTGETDAVAHDVEEPPSADDATPEAESDADEEHEDEPGTGETDAVAADAAESAVESEEPDEAEAAEEGTDEEPGTGETDAVVTDADEAMADVGSTEEAAAEAEPDEESASEGEAAGAGEPLTSIKGIGGAYAQRLEAEGVDSVADLAAADAEALSEGTGISEKRIGRWIDRAKAR